MIEEKEFEHKGITAPSLLRHFLKNKNLSESMEECLINPPGKYDPSWARELVQRYYEEVSKMLESFIDFTATLDDLSKVLERTVQLDANWMKAVICLAAQDVAVHKIAQKLGISDKPDGKRRYKSVGELLQEIENKLVRKGEKPSSVRLALRVARDYTEELRNEIIHKGTSLDHEKTSMLLDETKNMLQELARACTVQGPAPPWDPAGMFVPRTAQPLTEEELKFVLRELGVDSLDQALEKVLTGELPAEKVKKVYDALMES